MEEIKKLEEQNMQLHQENMNLRLRKLRMMSSADEIQVLWMKKEIADLQGRIKQLGNERRKLKGSVCSNWK